MFDICTLQSLYVSQIEGTSSLFEQGLRQFLISKNVPPFDIFDECRWQEPFLSEEKTLENWQQLLKLSVFCDLCQTYQSELSIKIRQFEHHPWNKSSQYFRSLVAVNHALAKMPIPEVGPQLLESGAALIDLHEYCPWLSLPYTPHHFEFGIYLCMIALMTKRDDLKEQVLRIVKWQLNTLDYEAKPLPGFFVREKEGRSLHHLSMSYLLFRCAILLTQEKIFSSIAEVTLQMIQSHIEQKKEKLDPLWILLEEWLNQYDHKEAPSSSEVNLPQHMHDTSTALVGYRSPALHVITTLHGEHTGLGAYRYHDIDVVNFGPQYLPLEDCRGFGIEGNALSDHGIRRSTIEWRREGSFTLKGCTRLVDQPSSTLMSRGIFRGIWLEMTQEFKNPHLSLKASFLGLDGWDAIAFTFFVKASRVKVDEQFIQPRSLGRYDGESRAIILEGEKHSLELHPIQSPGTMHVIPLAGGDDFWGADFLISYFMTPDQRDYQWRVGPY